MKHGFYLRLFAACALVLAGCGDNDESPGSSVLADSGSDQEASTGQGGGAGAGGAGQDAGKAGSAGQTVHDAGVDVTSPACGEGSVTAPCTCGTAQVDTGYCCNSVAQATECVVEEADYYVAPTGDDSNSGDKEHPFATWQHAWDVVQPGQLVYIRGGTYQFTGTLGDYACSFSNKSGSANNLIRIFAYPGEHPVFDFSDFEVPPGYHAIIHQEETNYAHFKGLRVTGLQQPTSGEAGYGWVVFDSSNVIWEQCEFDHIGGYGHYITGNSANNTVLNSDAHHCSNPYSAEPYGGSNGFNAIQIKPGYDNNVYRNCRAWMNSDDGFDTYGGEGSVVFDTCWAFWNGYVPEEGVPTQFVEAGDGDGFKLGGGNSIAYDGVIRRTVQNSVAAANKLMGFDQNGASFAIRIVNSAAYGNYGPSFHTQGDNHANFFRNNLVYANIGSTNINAAETDDHNSWNLALTLTDADFVSLVVADLAAPRNPDGTLPTVSFVHLAQGSQLIDQGTDVGLPFSGAAPDIGAFESNW